MFVLLLHQYQQARLDISLTMESPRQGRAIVDIKSTLAKHPLIVKNILPAHAISGCDTIASYFGLGKGTVIKVLKADYRMAHSCLRRLIDHRVINQATAFLSACYGIQKSSETSSMALW